MNTLTRIVIQDTVTRQTRELPVTELFIAIGHDPRSALVKSQVLLDEEGYILVQSDSSRANLPGVFAAGDLVDHTYRQALTAASTGLCSRPGRRALPGHAGFGAAIQAISCLTRPP